MGGPAYAEGGVETSVEQGVEATPKEMLKFTDSAIKEMEAAEKKVLTLLNEATRKGDKELLDCLRSKHASIKALTEVSRQTIRQMNEALAAGQGELATREFRKVAVALSKVRQFLAEAEACLGEAGVSPDSSITTFVGPDSEEDPTEDPDDLGWIDFDPPNASPFQ